MRLLLLVSLAWLLSACETAADGSIRMALANSAVDLDPRYATDAASSRINRLLYEPLVRFDEAMWPIPGLASWQTLSPQHYRFSLQQSDKRFHNGDLLTADDVAATYRSILDPAAASPHRQLFAHISEIRVRNERQLDFLLSRPDPLFPAYLSIGIMPEALIETGWNFHQNPIGSGPLELLDWPEQSRLRLQRRADGQRIELLTVKDPSVRMLKLLRGEVDVLQNDLPPELGRYLVQQKNVQVQHLGGSNFTYLGFNLNDTLTGNADIRRAIAHAVDREAILNYVLGRSSRAAQALLPPDHWAGHPELKALEHNPDKARQLLQKLGYNAESPLQLTYKTSSDPFRIRLATIIQHQLAEVGIQVKIQSYDWGTFYGDIKAGRFQMYSLSWVGIKTPDIFRQVFHSASVPPQGANRGRYASETVDQLIEQAESQTQLEQQIPYYRELQAQLLVDLPYVPLWYEGHIAAVREDIRGYRLAVDGNYDALTQIHRQPP